MGPSKVVDFALVEFKIARGQHLPQLLVGLLNWMYENEMKIEWACAATWWMV